MSKIQKFMNLNRAERADVVRAIMELAGARASLPFLSAKALHAMRADSSSSPRRTIIDRVSIAVSRVAPALPWRADCLVQSLAARRWLRSAGVPCSLIVGVRREGEELLSHAWLEIDGHVVIGGRDKPYKPIGAATDAKRRSGLG